MEAKEARRLFRVEVAEVFAPFSKYGMQDDIPDAIVRIIEVAEQLHKDLLTSKNGGTNA